MTNYTLYIHIFPNNKVYIGITGNSVTQRWGSNGECYRGQPHLYSAIKKYRWNNIKHEIILNNLSKEWASALEQMYIAEYRSTEKEFGYNHAIGGSVNSGWHYSVTPETREKISKSVTEWHKRLDIQEKFKHMHLGRYVSDETRRRLSDSHMGNVSGMLGKKHTIESRQKMSESHKGHVITEEQRRKISETSKGRKHSDETRRKISQANLGRHFSDEHRRKLSESRRKYLERKVAFNANS